MGYLLKPWKNECIVESTIGLLKVLEFIIPSKTPRIMFGFSLVRKVYVLSHAVVFTIFSLHFVLRLCIW